MAGIYLRECLAENVGPLAAIDLTFDLNPDGTPKPVVLVGKNGSGKTILLAYVLDALAELAKQKFSDVVLDQRIGHLPFVKVASSGDNRSLGSNHLCLLEFAGPDHRFTYIEKVGPLDPQPYDGRLRGRFQAVRNWPKDGPFHKQAVGDEKQIEQFFRAGSVCFFPASRHERPHWLNPTAIDDQPLFDLAGRKEGELKKPLVVERAADFNQQWLMDVLLDSLVDVELISTGAALPGQPFQYVMNPRAGVSIPDKMLLAVGRENVERLVRAVLEDPAAQLVLSYRHAVFGRVAVRLGNGVVVPSLTHLSAGQALLFNLFATVIRYADRADLNNSIRLDQIEGVILVDEIDAHLHTDLQYDVLPRLIKLFPRVQFIVTSHAPLFLLGMDREFGRDGFQILEMPAGRRIGTERFGEFRRSLDHYRATRAFEEEVEQRIRAAAKPLVLTEGQTDAEYIRAALDVFGHHDLLGALDIAHAGESGSTGARGGGDSHLNKVREVLRTNSPHFPRPVLLLYDSDTNKPSESIGATLVRAVPRNPANARVAKGIENLLPEWVFEDRFYGERTEPTGYGRDKVIPYLKKADLCAWVCQHHRTQETFRQFETLLTPVLHEFLARSGVAPVPGDRS